MHPDQGVRKRSDDVVEDEPHSLPFGAECLGQLGGHRDRVCVSRLGARRPGQLHEQRPQRVRLPLDLERPGLDVDDLAVRDARDLGVHAADVPAEYSAHTCE